MICCLIFYTSLSVKKDTSMSLWPTNQTPRPEPCDALAPLLSPYADGVATDGESRRVEAHLIGCDSCRETLFWTQATHRTLAARPVALPPADLRSRIASAIAASEAAPISLRPARVFALRSTYAAAASLTVLGIVLSYPLWHTPARTARPALPPAQVATQTPAAKPSPAALPHPRIVKTPHAQVAANTPHDAVPETIKPATVVKRLAIKHIPVPRVALPPERVADNIKAPPVPRVAPVVVKTPPKAPLRHLPDTQKVASTHVPIIAKAVPHLPPAKETPKAPSAVLIARVPPTHAPDAVQVHILPPTVERDPEVKMAVAPYSGDGIMRGVIASVNQMHTVALRSVALDTTRQSSRTASMAMRSLDSEHFAYVDGVHGQQ